MKKVFKRKTLTSQIRYQQERLQFLQFLLYPDLIRLLIPEKLPHPLVFDIFLVRYILCKRQHNIKKNKLIQWKK